MVVGRRKVLYGRLYFKDGLKFSHEPLVYRLMMGRWKSKSSYSAHIPVSLWGVQLEPAATDFISKFDEYTLINVMNVHDSAECIVRSRKVSFAYKGGIYTRKCQPLPSGERIGQSYQLRIYAISGNCEEKKSWDMVDTTKTNESNLGLAWLALGLPHS